MTKILYFYPENPLLINQGNNARANALLLYFKDRNFTVDFVGEETGDFTESHLREIEKEGLVNKGYLIRKYKRKGIKYLIKHSIPNRIKANRYFKKRIGVGQKEDFESVLKNNSYDYIIVSYVLFAPFIANKEIIGKAKTIVDTHDFLTAQFIDFKGFKLGEAFETEMKMLNKFDSIWSISSEESFIFSQFLPQKDITIIAHGMENKSNLKKANAKIDVLYVASNNPHNRKSAIWFFEKVYPLLSKNINITVVGRVCTVISEYKNVQKIAYIENLDTLYEESKITICPMLSGTGLKIKVVESLSYGIPVVCNERGVDGLLCKINNGCLVTNDNVKFAENITHLLEDEEFYNTHSTNAKNLFSSSLEKKFVYKKLDSFFNKP